MCVYVSVSVSVSFFSVRKFTFRLSDRESIEKVWAWKIERLRAGIDGVRVLEGQARP